MEGPIASEQAVLGGLMIDPSRYAEIDLAPEDFSRNDHSEIYRAILACIDRRISADAVTVSEWLERQSSEDPRRWLVYCAALVRDTPSAHNVRNYAAAVKRHANAARAKGIAQGMIDSIDQEPEVIDDTIRSLMKLTATQRSYECRIGDTLGGLIDYIDERYQNRGVIPGLRTGLDKLDRSLHGLGKGHLIVIAARPGMGKTALMGGIHLANRNRSTGIMSAEMPRNELVLRMVASIAEVPFTDLKMGTIADSDWSRVNVAFSMLKNLPMYINDRSAPSIDEIMRQARKWKYEHKIELLSVDYIQRIPSPRGITKRNEAVEHIVRGLKEAARELEIPVVALSAVNRDVESRQDKRPLMSDLRDSGAIEAEADQIITLYRDEVYYDDDKYKGLAELAAIKNRHGPLGTAKVHYNGPLLTFSDFGVDCGGNGSGSLFGRDGAA